MSKLQKKELLQSYFDNGMAQKEMAAKFGVGISCISKWKKNWNIILTPKKVQKKCTPIQNLDKPISVNNNCPLPPARVPLMKSKELSSLTLEMIKAKVVENIDIGSNADQRSWANIGLSALDKELKYKQSQKNPLLEDDD